MLIPLTLMDFKVDQHPGSVHFAYVLPHDANKALIEITAFTPELYSEAHFHKAFIRYVERIAIDQKTVGTGSWNRSRGSFPCTSATMRAN